jgi:ADP-L-glycero-D-manno-heptose 6-epimerase
MSTNSTILITGAAGFIGSCMAGFLNEKGFEKLLLCDDFGVEGKRKNWEGKQYETLIERYNLFEWLEANDPEIDFVFHLGARTDTTEFNYAVHQELNVDFTQNLWNWCTKNKVPLVYASSAATYGAGELGYEDNEAIIPQLQPLNPYGVSKNEIDKWILQQTETPPFWAGLKFFNVYGPNEAHKGRMASVIWHSFNQIKKNGEVKLFRSHRPDFKDGQQLRDFVYVKDVVKVMYWLFESAVGSQQLAEEQSGVELEIESAIAESQMSPEVGKSESREEEKGTGDWRQALNESWEDESATSRSQLTTNNSQLKSAIYNLGTGTARSFYDLASATFRGLDLEPNIVFIDMPEDIRDKYQYFTEADMHKLQAAGYNEPFFTLEEGVDDYVRHYLAKGMLY